MFNEFVYVLKAGPFFKIGRTNDVTRRIAQLATQMPFPVELFKVFNTNDSRALEATLHSKLEKFRVNGEWFELDRPSSIFLYLMPATDNDGFSNDWMAFMDDIVNYFKPKRRAEKIDNTEAT